MVEYGNAVGQVAGQAGGGHGGNVDLGTQVGQFVSDSAQTISTMPPAMLAAGVVLIILALVFVRRAF